MYMMTVTDLLNEIHYVTNKNGQPTAVQIDLIVWQKIVSRLQTREAPNEWDAAMEREETAYIDLHPTLWPSYKGQHVAIHEGKLVDSDEDGIALYERIQEKYPDEFVLITQVKEQPVETVHVHSNYSPRE